MLQIGAITRSTASKIAESLYANDLKKLQKSIAEYMDNQYKIKSNRESGDGRYDISLIPREKKYPGIIMELKWKKGLDSEGLEVLAEEALVQINSKRYGLEMKEEGMEVILKLGIGFSGKKVRMKMG